MSIDLNEVHEVRVYNRQAEQIGINVLHYQVRAVTGTGATLAEEAIVLSGIFAPLYRALMPSNARYFGLTVRKVNPSPISIPWLSTQGAGPGTLSFALLPRQSAGLITWTTHRAGRHGHGRIYVAFPPTVAIDGLGALHPVYIAPMLNLANAYILDDTIVGVAGTTEITPVVWNRRDKIVTDVKGFRIYEAGMATQRRRGSLGRANPLPA